MYGAKYYKLTSRSAPESKPDQPKTFGDGFDVEANARSLPTLTQNPDGWDVIETVKLSRIYDTPEDALSPYHFTRWAQNLFTSHGKRLGLARTGGTDDVPEVTAYNFTQKQ